MPTTSADVRKQLVDALGLDLVGPGHGSPLADEVLDERPSRWYLCGYLVPIDADEEQKSDTGEAVDEAGNGGGVDDAVTPEAEAAKTAHLPSSIGLSFLVPKVLSGVSVTARFGDYEPEAEDGLGRPRRWRRTQRQVNVNLEVPAETSEPLVTTLPETNGMEVALTVRAVTVERLKGARSVSVFLVNRRQPAPDSVADRGFAFQAELEVTSDVPLVPQPNLRGQGSSDWDEAVADLQYRDVLEYAVGHGVATVAERSADAVCRSIRTCWIPCEEVEKVAASALTGVELGMKALSRLGSGAEARERLGALPRTYRGWIAAQRDRADRLDPKRQETKVELLARAETAARRIEAGIALLDDPIVREAFTIANRAMARAMEQRTKAAGADPRASEPAWRPFQLAFVLLNLPGLVEPKGPDRELVDLLFFPTGGGKTEAYLGLAAFTIVLRRLRDPEMTSAGAVVLMRYTLRLLTLDQLGRAATLICALELERVEAETRLGAWPFEIGLWVGRATTPNRMGRKGDPDQDSARTRTQRFQADPKTRPSPIPLEECPWCGTKFGRNSFQLLPNPDSPRELKVVCASRDCDFTRGRALPIVAVDDVIYRRLPCFLIATVDKFAAMPWTGEVGALFGRVDRFDRDGFYGPASPGEGRALPRQLAPPELIIQDELHLISGPMGTMVGLYESALDALCTRQDEGRPIRPKIVASTATVRRAETQIRALFGRREVDVFPPPGPDRRDSFFAHTQAVAEANGRFYLGIAAQGRSLKVVLLRAYLALLGAAQKAFLAAGGKRNPGNPADPYMTLLGYFNSLRELGGSRRIVEDDVSQTLRRYGSRRRSGESEGLFADRAIAFDVVELTSRVKTHLVSEAKRRLAQPFSTEGDAVDVAIATNMISVGLDITRLGLMVVLGQPKTSAEYIQATSRVGRDDQRPGLVVTLLNVHRPRDRSHYERFSAYHRSFYRTVEALSVTPFSPRALDRGLAGALVGLARHTNPAMTPARGAAEVAKERGRLQLVAETLAERAANHARLTETEAKALRDRVRGLSADLLDSWVVVADDYAANAVDLQYQREVGGGKPLLHDFLDPELEKLGPHHRKFRAGRSLRDVEAGVDLWLKSLDGHELEPEDEAR